MLKRIVLLLNGLLFLLFSTFVQTTLADRQGYQGMRSLPGWWRPFNGGDPANPSNISPWNKPIPATATDHPESGYIIDDMQNHWHAKVRFADDYQSTLHVVNSNNANLPKYLYHAQKEGGSNTNIYRFTHSQNFYNPDVDGDDITNANTPYPFIPGKTKPEPFPPNGDGRMTIVDVNTNYAYEVSQGKADLDTCLPTSHVWCSTFNVWDLSGTGTVTYRPVCNQWPACDAWWQCAGGRGAGVPVIAGIVRPEELYYAVSSEGDGIIHHALSFAYDRNRRMRYDEVEHRWVMCGPLYPFAYRNDGLYPGKDYPIEGMQFQLKNTFNVDSIDNQYGRVIARTLQIYGAVLVDNGGGNSMSFNLQNLSGVDSTPPGNVISNREAWEREFPGFYYSIESNIEPGDFRVVNTPVTLGAEILDDHPAD